MTVIADYFKKHGILLTGLLVFLTRLPFLAAGYGSEEDSWGMAVTAKKIALSGIYEYSRLPGHPVQEMVYLALWDAGPFVYNIITAIISTCGIIFFMLALKKAGIKYHIIAGLTLAFTPVVYIASTNAMDYTWAMSFALICFYLLLSSRFILAGLALGIAIGCRITSALYLLPFLLLFIHYKERKINITGAWQFIAVTVLTALLTFIPLFYQYGLGFFTFYDTIYPSFAKAFYKFSFAVYGTIGFFAVILLKLHIIISKKLLQEEDSEIKKTISLIAIAVILIYILLYWYLPQKAAFMIPAIPFIIIWFAMRLDKRKMMLLTAGFMFSCFFCGINLSDAYRGGKPSPLSIEFKAGSQKAAFDPLIGTVTDEYLKRKQCVAYARQVAEVTDTINVKTAVIAGWWQGVISLQENPSKKGKTVFYYYIREDSLISLKEQGYAIWFLPEQDFFNDQRYAGNFTARYALPWKW